jgi:hypothetical protein
MNSKALLATAVACLFASISSPVRAADLAYEWYTVANNGDTMPTTASRECSSCHDDVAGGGATATAKRFNSYNQPAVNRLGVVVFRARSRGGEGQGPGQGEPERGIYMRHLAQQGPLYAVYRRHGTVPPPNNTTIGKDKALASFNEFPSVPRIDSGSDTMATRGQSTPVWTYTAPDGIETRTGTAGIYTNLHRVGATAASMVGDVYAHDASGTVVQSFPQFQVPIHTGVAVGTGFDQFPGSPAVTDRTTIVFKGNFTAGGLSRTGVFYRDVVGAKGLAPVELIAASRYTDIPGCKPKGSAPCKFGSTAPPSADGKYAVFVGYDVEAAPTKGGIYRARLGNKPIALETVVQIDDPVPGEPAGAKFQVFGESVTVASGGRLVVFWGGWGDTHPVDMDCPAEGNAAMRQACKDATPPGTTRPVPNKQGFFVRDMQLGTTTVIAKSGGEFVDFVYWNFSGRVPGKGEGEEGDDIEEPARWRSATFGAVSGSGVPGIAAFKALSADGEQGIYLRRFLPSGTGELVKLIKTGDPAAAVDPEAPAGAVISALGIERDGFRGNWFAVNLSMLSASDIAIAAAGGETSEEDTGWAGIYAARLIGVE